MSTVFNLPDLGEGLTDSEIVAWLVQEGDTVTLNQPLAEIETAKAVVELPSPYAGKITKLYAGAGDTVLVGAPLIEFLSDEAAPAPAEVQNEAQEAQKEERVQVLVGSVRVGKGNLKRTPRAWQTEAYVREATARTKTTSARRPAPPLRAYAKQKGVDLDAVSTGQEALSRQDIDALSKPRVRTVPVRGLRKHTAAAMAKSYREVPHATVFVDADVTETVELLRSLRAKYGHDKAPSFLSLVARALTHACQVVPEANASFDEAAGVIHYFESVNLGVAVSTPRGLVVASVDDANTLDATQVTERIATLRAKALAGELSMHELQNSTITISNVGVFGVDTGTPIINPGEAMILALGAVRKKPWEYRGEIALREIVSLAASFDHRLLDGSEASRFLGEIAQILESPALLLAK